MSTQEKNVSEAARPERDEEGFILVYSEDDIPEFKSEREEHNFWSTHAFSEEFIDRAAAKNEDIPAPPVRKRSTSTSLRLDEDTLERLRHLARKKGKGYQTLLKEFVVERLYEEEKREGVLR